MSKKRFMKSAYRCFLALGALFLAEQEMAAQDPYRFVCTDYSRLTDRVPNASSMTFDEVSNTFTISQPGTNNIAFGMDKATKDNAYYIKGSQNWFVIEGTGLSNAFGSSFIWWMNGYNQFGSEAPNEILTTSNNSQLLLWNIAERPSINGYMDFTSPTINISSNGNTLISAIGLTGINGTATIKNIQHYDRYEVVFNYPEAIGTVGFFTMENLISSVKTELGDAIRAAEEILNTVADSEAKTALANIVAEAKEIQGRTINNVEGAAEVHAQISAVREAVNDYKKDTPIVSWEATENGFIATLNGLKTQVVTYSDKMIRVYKSYHGDLAKKRSQSVVAQPGFLGVSVNEENQVITMSTEKVVVKYALKTGQLTFERVDGTVLLTEKEYGTEFIATKDGPFDSYKIANSFQLKQDEQIYGMGQIQNGDLNQRGKSLHLEQDNTKVCIPYFQSTRNYGFFWDNYSPTDFSDNATVTRFKSVGTEIDYYVLAGDDSHDVLSLMRTLTGTSPMPTLWNFGLYQSKERYVSSKEVREVLSKYREMGVPLDCMVQDWQYWGTDNNNWNALAFENPEYLDGEQMIADVHAQNAKLMISIWANFGPNTRPYKELNALGRLIPVGKNGSFPGGFYVFPYDVYDENARGIYWKYLYDGLASKGVDAYWMDSTEPDYFNHLESDLDYLSGCGQTWRSLRNAFPIAHVGGVHDNHRATEAKGEGALTGKRVSILTRSGFAGQQRYGANTWSGDVAASWQNFANQIPAACNFSASGIPYWNSDIGGFFTTDDLRGIGDPNWRNLYMRWAQFGTFSPMMRFHGTGTPREIYQFGEANDGIGDFDQLLKYIKIRYRMLPYLYSTAWQVCSNNRTFMQALPIAFNEDVAGYNVKDQYMFGDAFLVAPVIQEGAVSREVYLPANHKWIDFWTGETFEGGQTVTKKAPTDIMPLYVKGGSIMPWGPDVQYSTEKNWDNLEIRVYAGADGTFTLYEDENDNYNYEQGKYTVIPFEWDEASQTLTIGDRQGAFEGMLQSRTFNICLVSPLHGEGDLHETEYHATVAYTGKAVSVQLQADEILEITKTECTEHITNPSFETGTTEGWTVDVNTAWSGINRGGGSGDPDATDGTYIFGVWDGANDKNAKISQRITTLEEGVYELTVDMHASNRINVPRVGNQRLFAGKAKALFKDQILSAGTGDNYPMQTITLRFYVAKDNDPVEIGVTTDGAQYDTWFKIDNFRLYKVEGEGLNTVKPVRGKHGDIVNVYNTNGVMVKSNVTSADALDGLAHGVYIVDGKKFAK